MVKIISFDIGIKNLALCVFDTNTELSNNIIKKIVKWDVLDISQSETINKKCNIKNCNVDIKYKKNDIQYCTRHAKSKLNISKYKIPSKEYKKSAIKKLKINDLRDLISKILKKPSVELKKVKKNELLEKYNKYYEDIYLDEIEKTNANKIELVDIGKNIMLQLNELFKEMEMVEIVLIENQIGPLANRMKTIQGMLSQYFIMNNVEKIEFVSSNNKLKEFTEGKTNYQERKKLAIEIMKNELKKYNDINLENKFSTHKKKDDLADSYLQGLWYIKNKKLK